MRSDAELLAASGREPAAFRELYDRYATRVYGYQLRRSRDPDAAHDLTAETFAQAWLVRKRFRDEASGSIGPWLFGIARNVLLASVRRGRLERASSERLGLELPRAAARPDETWLDGLDEAFDSLPETQQDAIRLRVLEDRDYPDVAELLGTTEQAARVRVHRGLATLRNRLTTREELTR